MAGGGGGSPTKGLEVCAKDGTAFAFCERCYKSEHVEDEHRCILDAKNRETDAKKKPVEKKKKPKRPPPTAFYIFMICFREIYQHENQHVNLKDVPKLGGEKWKSFTIEEKKVYRDKAAQLMEKYNKSLTDADDEEEDEEKETDDAEEKEANEVENKKDAANGVQTGRGRRRVHRGRGRGSRVWLGVFG